MYLKQLRSYSYMLPITEHVKVLWYHIFYFSGMEFPPYTIDKVLNLSLICVQCIFVLFLKIILKCTGVCICVCVLNMKNQSVSTICNLLAFYLCKGRSAPWMTDVFL